MDDHGIEKDEPHVVHKSKRIVSMIMSEEEEKILQRILYSTKSGNEVCNYTLKGTYITTLPLVFFNGHPANLDTVSEDALEKFVTFMLQCSYGKSDLKTEVVPDWWPTDLPFNLPIIKPPSIPYQWMLVLKSMVCRCYSLNGNEFLLGLSSHLSRMPNESLCFVETWHGTTSLFYATNGKLIATIRTANRYFDQTLTGLQKTLFLKPGQSLPPDIPEMFLCDSCSRENDSHTTIKDRFMDFLGMERNLCSKQENMNIVKCKSFGDRRLFLDIDSVMYPYVPLSCPFGRKIEIFSHILPVKPQLNYDNNDALCQTEDMTSNNVEKDQKWRITWRSKRKNLRANKRKKCKVKGCNTDNNSSNIIIIKKKELIIPESKKKKKKNIRKRHQNGNWCHTYSFSKQERRIRFVALDAGLNEKCSALITKCSGLQINVERLTEEQISQGSKGVDMKPNSSASDHTLTRNASIQSPLKTVTPVNECSNISNVKVIPEGLANFDLNKKKKLSKKSNISENCEESLKKKCGEDRTGSQMKKNDNNPEFFQSLELIGPKNFKKNHWHEIGKFSQNTNTDVKIYSNSKRSKGENTSELGACCDESSDTNNNDSEMKNGKSKHLDHCYDKKFPVTFEETNSSVISTPFKDNNADIIDLTHDDDETDIIDLTLCLKQKYGVEGFLGFDSKDGIENGYSDRNSFAYISTDPQLYGFSPEVDFLPAPVNVSEAPSKRHFAMFGKNGAQDCEEIHEKTSLKTSVSDDVEFVDITIDLTGSVRETLLERTGRKSNHTHNIFQKANDIVTGDANMVPTARNIGLLCNRGQTDILCNTGLNDFAQNIGLDNFAHNTRSTDLTHNTNSTASVHYTNTNSTNFSHNTGSTDTSRNTGSREFTYDTRTVLAHNGKSSGILRNTKECDLLHNTRSSSILHKTRSNRMGHNTKSSGMGHNTRSNGLIHNRKSSGLLRNRNTRSSGLLHNTSSGGLLHNLRSSGLLHNPESSGLVHNTRSSGLLHNTRSNGLLHNTKLSGSLQNTKLNSSLHNTRSSSSPQNTKFSILPRTMQSNSSPHNTRSMSSPHNTRSMSSPHNTRSMSSPHNTRSMSSPHNTRSMSSPHNTRSTSSLYNTRSRSSLHNTRSSSLTHNTSNTRLSSLKHNTRSKSLPHNTRSSDLAHNKRSRSIECNRRSEIAHSKERITVANSTNESDMVENKEAAELSHEAKILNVSTRKDIMHSSKKAILLTNNIEKSEKCVPVQSKEIVQSEINGMMTRKKIYKSLSYDTAKITLDPLVNQSSKQKPRVLNITVGDNRVLRANEKLSHCINTSDGSKESSKAIRPSKRMSSRSFEHISPINKAKSSKIYTQKILKRIKNIKEISRSSFSHLNKNCSSECESHRNNYFQSTSGSCENDENINIRLANVSEEGLQKYIYFQHPYDPKVKNYTIFEKVQEYTLVLNEEQDYVLVPKPRVFVLIAGVSGLGQKVPKSFALEVSKSLSTKAPYLKIPKLPKSLVSKVPVLSIPRVPRLLITETLKSWVPRSMLSKMSKPTVSEVPGSFVTRAPELKLQSLQSFDNNGSNSLVSELMVSFVPCECDPNELEMALISDKQTSHTPRIHNNWRILKKQKSAANLNKQQNIMAFRNGQANVMVQKVKQILAVPNKQKNTEVFVDKSSFNVNDDDKLLASIPCISRTDKLSPLALSSNNVIRESVVSSERNNIFKHLPNKEYAYGKIDTNRKNTYLSSNSEVCTPFSVLKNIPREMTNQVMNETTVKSYSSQENFQEDFLPKSLPILKSVNSNQHKESHHVSSCSTDDSGMYDITSHDSDLEMNIQDSDDDYVPLSKRLNLEESSSSLTVTSTDEFTTQSIFRHSVNQLKCVVCAGPLSSDKDIKLLDSAKELTHTSDKQQKNNNKENKENFFISSKPVNEWCNNKVKGKSETCQETITSKCSYNLRGHSLQKKDSVKDKHTAKKEVFSSSSSNKNSDTSSRGRRTSYFRKSKRRNNSQQKPKLKKGKSFVLIDDEENAEVMIDGSTKSLTRELKSLLSDECKELTRLGLVRKSVQIEESENQVPTEEQLAQEKYSLHVENTRLLAINDALCVINFPLEHIF